MAFATPTHVSFHRRSFLSSHSPRVAPERPLPVSPARRSQAVPVARVRIASATSQARLPLSPFLSRGAAMRVMAAVEPPRSTEALGGSKSAPPTNDMADLGRGARVRGLTRQAALAAMATYYSMLRSEAGRGVDERRKVYFTRQGGLASDWIPPAAGA